MVAISKGTDGEGDVAELAGLGSRSHLVLSRKSGRLKTIFIFELHNQVPFSTIRDRAACAMWKKQLVTFTSVVRKYYT